MQQNQRFFFVYVTDSSLSVLAPTIPIMQLDQDSQDLGVSADVGSPLMSYLLFVIIYVLTHCTIIIGKLLILFKTVLCWCTWFQVKAVEQRWWAHCRVSSTPPPL